MKNKTFFVFGLIFAALALVIFIAGCKKNSTSSTSGTQTVLKTFTALKTSMQAGDSSLVQAKVTDQDDNPYNNVRVNFSASPVSLGSFRDTYDMTDTSGTASTYFVSSDTGTVTLKAKLTSGDSLTTTLHITSSGSGSSSDTIASIEFTSAKSSIQVKGTGGIESAVLVATGYDELGNKIGAGTQIIFRILNGPHGGENLEDKGYGPDTVYTGTSGQALVTLNSGTISGTVELRAESGTIFSDVTRVTINAGPPAYLSLGAEPLNIRGWDVVNVTSDILAMVDDIYGNPVQNGTAVYFGTEEGMVDAYATTSGGLATSVYHSGEPRNDGLAHIYASTAGGTVSDTVLIIVSGPPDTTTFLTYPLSLLADGTSKGDVIVRVVDLNGNFVVGGTNVSMETDFGNCASGTTQDGIYTSIFETELVSQTLTRDYSPVSPDDGIGAVSNLTAKADRSSATVQVDFLTGLAYYKNCQVDINGTVVYGGREPFTVLIKDRAGNPLGGHSLSATVSSGTISGSPSITNGYGESSGLFFNAPADTTIKSATISVTDNDPRGGGMVLTKKVSLSATFAKKK
jgi:hypothetical protein